MEYVYTATGPTVKSCLAREKAEKNPNTSKLMAYSDANWCNNQGNGESMSSYFAFLANNLVNFKVELQGMTC